MIKKLVLLTWLLISLINFDIVSQSKEANKNSFYFAESRLLFEDYNEALFNYQQLLKVYPNNSNFIFRIGQCYLHIPGQKDKAIPYLEEAVKHINPDYNKGKFSETGAPYDALYYLANAYRVNNKFEKAIETYKTLRKNINSEVYDTTIVANEIQSCLNAKELIKKPVYIKENNIGKIINGSNSEFNPVISDNEDLIIFSRSQPFYDAILFSTKNKGQWSTPVNMNGLLKVDRDLYPTSLSKDGKVLYLYSSASYDGNIYTSRNENNKWSPIVKLNGNINTKYWESHAAISHDNKKLYFTSNRKGSRGGLDIFVSVRDSTGDWGPAVNLGPVINTIYNEESPFLSKDDKTLFFSSRGHFNMGGYDIFYSRLQDNGEWSDPVNVGYPFNTTDDDLFYKPLNEGFEGYLSIDNPGGFGKEDIYRIIKYSDDHPRTFFVRGMVKVADSESNLRDTVKISTANIKKPNQNLVHYSTPRTGDYELQLPQGNYNITYEAAGSEKTVRSLDLPLTFPSDTIDLPAIILPKSELVASLNVETGKTVPEKKIIPVLLPLNNKPELPGTGNQKPGYDRSVNDSLIAAFIAALRRRATDNIAKLVSDASLENQKFKRVDDPVSYLKDEASKINIIHEKIDILTLRVAVMDNILSQAAVDLLEKYSEGELKEILTDLDIYQANLITWTDLLEYILAKSGGRISKDDVNKLAADILSGVDPSISILREKILAFSENYEQGAIVRKSVSITDTSNIRLIGKWLLGFYNESLKQGLTIKQISEMLAILSTSPDARVGQLLRDLTVESEKPLHSSLQAINLKKEKIKLPKDLIMFLVTNKDEEKYPKEEVFKSIAEVIISRKTPTDIIASQLKTGNNIKSWISWIAAGGLLLFIFIIFWKRKKKKSDETNK